MIVRSFFLVAKGPQLDMPHALCVVCHTTHVPPATMSGRKEIVYPESRMLGRCFVPTFRLMDCAVFNYAYNLRDQRHLPWRTTSISSRPPSQVRGAADPGPSSLHGATARGTREGPLELGLSDRSSSRPSSVSSTSSRAFSGSSEMSLLRMATEE